MLLLLALAFDLAGVFGLEEPIAARGLCLMYDCLTIDFSRLSWTGGLAPPEMQSMCENSLSSAASLDALAAAACGRTKVSQHSGVVCVHACDRRLTFLSFFAVFSGRMSEAVEM